jgi:hypothetical protein
MLVRNEWLAWRNEETTDRQVGCGATPPTPALPIKNFLTLWKDADPAIPILIAAKSEYAKLQ